MHLYKLAYDFSVMLSKILTTMTVKKQLRLTAATSKNYEIGQIHALKG